jgi:hypothetical protein
METNAFAATSRTAWSMDRGTARSFRPGSAGVLRVTSGRAWATLSPAAASPQARWSPELDPGDIFVGPGSALPLRAGQTVVVESWPTDRDNCTCLVWEAAAPSPGALRWQGAVGQPAQELGRSLLQAAAAAARLVRGLSGYFWPARHGAGATCCQ